MKAALAQPEPDFATVNEFYAPDHVFVPLAADMLEREARGARGFQAWREETRESWARSTTSRARLMSALTRCSP